MKKAVELPKDHFDRPMDIVSDTSLSVQEKEEALARWEAQERRIEVATEEGMAGGPSSALDAVHAAQEAMNAHKSAERAPNKG